MRETGFDRERAIGVFRMPDDKLILMGGNHRLAAMRQLGEKTIPAVIFDWEDVGRVTRVFYTTRYPDAFVGYDVD